jgi:hypothetical protein
LFSSSGVVWEREAKQNTRERSDENAQTPFLRLFFFFSLFFFFFFFSFFESLFPAPSSVLPGLFRRGKSTSIATPARWCRYRFCDGVFGPVRVAVWNDRTERRPVWNHDDARRRRRRRRRKRRRVSDARSVEDESGGENFGGWNAGADVAETIADFQNHRRDGRERDVVVVFVVECE